MHCMYTFVVIFSVGISGHKHKRKGGHSPTLFKAKINVNMSKDHPTLEGQSIITDSGETTVSKV